MTSTKNDRDWFLWLLFVHIADEKITNLITICELLFEVKGPKKTSLSQTCIQNITINVPGKQHDDYVTLAGCRLASQVGASFNHNTFWHHWILPWEHQHFSTEILFSSPLGFEISQNTSLKERKKIPHPPQRFHVYKRYPDLFGFISACGSLLDDQSLLSASWQLLRQQKMSWWHQRGPDLHGRFTSNDFTLPPPPLKLILFSLRVKLNCFKLRWPQDPSNPDHWLDRCIF